MQSTTFVSRTRINRASKSINSCLGISFLPTLFLLMTACSSSDDSGVTSTAPPTPPPPALPAPPDPIAIVSVDSSGNQGNGNSYDCGESCTSLSTTGRYVVFYSFADNLVSGDTNGGGDAFLRDMETGTTRRVSVPNLTDQGTLGLEAFNGSPFDELNPSVSSSGRFVVFDGAASVSNLVLDDTNGFDDIFMHDTQSGETVRVSVPNLADQAGLGTQANSDSERACVSDDGRYVGFMSSATNLVTGDNNNDNDVFVHDRQTGATELVSRHTDGTPGDDRSGDCVISSDGNIVAFFSNATTLVTGDSNGGADIFVHDRASGTTTRVSVDSAGNEGTGGGFSGSFSPSISGDGRYVVFYSRYTNLVADDTNDETDIFVHDRSTGETSRVSVPNLVDQGTLGFEADGESLYPAISDDGRYVAWASNSTNLVLNDTNNFYDIFVHDRQTGRTARVNVDENGNEMTTGFMSDWAGISGDGRYVNFYGGPRSDGGVDPDIVSDTNGFEDVYRAPNPLWE
ncbi:MAG: PD40 domain-containing protein [Thiotrichales bacterium]|nr:MAG: PD40 domain-containing protein [Thiotrichales bacterium]